MVEVDQQPGGEHERHMEHDEDQKPNQYQEVQRPRGLDAEDLADRLNSVDHFTPHFDDKPVDEIATEDVEDFIDACLDEEDRLDRGLGPLSVKTVRNLYVHLNGIFEFAVS